jgi:hypothetical protein
MPPVPASPLEKFASHLIVTASSLWTVESLAAGGAHGALEVVAKTLSTLGGVPGS